MILDEQNFFNYQILKYFVKYDVQKCFKNMM